jgi:hypothetical protein
MPRLHTRQKRKLDITSSTQGKYRNVKGKHGPKTFSTEERAHEYAKTNKIENYTLVPAKKGKKFKIVSKE